MILIFKILFYFILCLFYCYKACHIYFSHVNHNIGMCIGCCWKVLDEQDLMGFIW